VAEISETKTPKPGEWWLRNSGGRIFYISGFTPEGWVVHYNENVGLYWSKMRFFCQEFRHEPRCTGFGWVKPPEETVRTIDVNPGEGYRWLEDDEIVTFTDEVFRPDLSPCWVTPLTRAGYTVAYRGSDDYPVRRSIARTQPVEPPEEVFPKYYILDETKGVCKSPWYIKRTSDKEGLRWGLNCDGVTVGFESQSWGGQADTWLEVTEAEALARVAIDPDDMPLNPVPGKVVATGIVTFTPVKSPDDMAAIIAEHTQQVRELTQRIGELVQQVNERDAVIEEIRATVRQEFSV
jgi:hypothetical protein